LQSAKNTAIKLYLQRCQDHKMCYYWDCTIGIMVSFEG